MRIAACQTPDVQGDVDAAVAIIEAAVGEARNVGASMACFPEGFLQGYSRDASTVRERSLTVDAICSAVRGVRGFEGVIVLGAFEQDGDAHYNSAVVLQHGEPLGIYRKRRPLDDEPVAVGIRPLIVEVDGARVGIGICSDARHDDLAMDYVDTDVVAYLLNNRLPLEIANRWRLRHGEVLARRARQTGSWVVSADVVHDGIDSRCFGCTAVMDPAGMVRDSVPELVSGMVLVDVEPAGYQGAHHDGYRIKRP